MKRRALKLVFEKSKPGHCAGCFPPGNVPVGELPKEFQRQSPLHLPEMAEVDIMRHYMELSRHAFGVETGFYPLGSCTMKYNPKINEDVAALPGFAAIHPLQPQETVQGCLAAMDLLQKSLCEITGMDGFTLSPAAGSHGEWTGLQLIKAYHASRGDHARNKVIVPDAAHGTNPANAATSGLGVINIPSTPEGLVDLEALRAAVGPDTAALMLTNPNTLGIFDKHILEIQKIVHEAGGLTYYDGANMNAIMGVVRPGDMGFDVIHLNLHKTFSTPHGGGGPGAGPVGCKAHLLPFLPKPVVVKDGDVYKLDFERPQSIGAVKSFYGNFLVCIRALTYILSLGSDGLREASQNAVLNANYMREALAKVYDIPHAGPCMHEFVMSLQDLKDEVGVSAMDIAKALLDYGIHPPTMYFPLIVHEALMVEPTETESRETLDEAIAAFIAIYNQAKEEPQALHAAPVTTYVQRLDDVQAARNPKLTYKFED